MTAIILSIQSNLCNKDKVHAQAKELYENYAAVRDDDVQEDHDIFDKLDELVLGDLKLLPNDNLKILEKIRQHIYKKYVKKINKVEMVITDDVEDPDLNTNQVFM